MNTRMDLGADTGILTEPGAALKALHHKTGHRNGPEKSQFDAIVIGAGQAGLSASYHLHRLGVDFVVFEADRRVGDIWRRRWDSLRLFTPARFDGLDGFPFPANPDTFPTKDQMADYLETYVRRFELPVFTGMPVESLKRGDGHYIVQVHGRQYRAAHVVIAAASYQKPRIPAFAVDLDPGILQLHSIDYRNPSQLQDGGVLLVGAGNSGAEIAMDLAGRHSVWLAGRDVGQVPFRIDSLLGRKLLLRLVLRGLFHRLLTTGTPMGRRFRPVFLSQGGPLIRTRRKNLDDAGVVRVPRMTGVEAGLPRLEDGTVPDIKNVIWCTGFHPGLTWIDLPVLGDDGRPLHESGIVPGEPGLYFVGLHFLYSVSSTMIHGVGRDARKVAVRVSKRLTSKAHA